MEALTAGISPTTIQELQEQYEETEALPENLDSSPNPLFKLRYGLQSKIETHKLAIQRTLLGTLIATYVVFLGFAIETSLDTAKVLLIITGLVILLLLYTYISNHWGTKIETLYIQPGTHFLKKHWKTLKW